MPSQGAISLFWFFSSYAKSEELIEHVSHIYRFKCHLCPTFFGIFDDLRKHNCIGENLILGRCDECQAVFTFTGHLHIHKFRKHQKEFEFICSVCTAAFAKSEELIQHNSQECTPNMPLIEIICEQCRSWYYIKKEGQNDEPYYCHFCQDRE